VKYVKRRCILAGKVVMLFANRRRGLQQTGVELAGLGATVYGISLLPIFGDALAFMAGGVVVFVYAQGLSDADR